MSVKRSAVTKLSGKHVYALKKDGTVIDGKLVSIKGNRVLIRPKKGKAYTKAILPLVLFDLLAVGTAPYAYGFGYGYPGYGYGYGYGYPGYGPWFY